jgi:hypothetical protein
VYLRKLTLRPLIILILLFKIENAIAQSSNLTWDGFIDTYYAFDFNVPPSGDRSFTTLPARHNEFNVNLASIGASYNENNVRGRLALQVGTSVEANYSSEPIKGQFSNEDMVKHIQEAYIGTQIGENTWIDAGIFFSHIGLESFISKNNMTYSRSLVADFSPYYQAGAKIHHDFSKAFSAEILVLNGWQIVTDNNSDKAIGTKIAYAFTDKTSLSYSTFTGNESEFRNFHDLVLQSALTDHWKIAVQADIGFQKKPISNNDSTWSGFTLISQYLLNEKNILTNRIEYYSDPDQVIVNTNTPHGFKLWSTSIGFDRNLNSKTLWRNEYRYYGAQEKIFPFKASLAKNDSILISSLCLSF